MPRRGWPQAVLSWVLPALLVASCSATSDQEAKPKALQLPAAQLATAQLAMAQLAYRGQEYGCSGILVNRRWVLTAGHCVVETASTLRPSARFQVRLMRSDRSDLDLFGVDRIELADGYSDRGADEFLLNDAALLHLDHPATAHPVGLASAELEVGTTATELGWGCNPQSTGSCVLFAPQPKTANIHVTQDKVCGMKPAEGKKLICTDPVPSFGVGDSGGSLLIPGTNGPLVAGVISGHANKNEYLTSITAVRNWINQTIG